MSYSVSRKKNQKKLQNSKKAVSLQTQKQTTGAIAQLVEQRTENPCVTGSNPVGATEEPLI